MVQTSNCKATTLDRGEGGLQQDSIFHLRLTSKLSKGMLSPRFTPECIKRFASVGGKSGSSTEVYYDKLRFGAFPATMEWKNSASVQWSPGDNRGRQFKATIWRKGLKSVSYKSESHLKGIWLRYNTIAAAGNAGYHRPSYTFPRGVGKKESFLGWKHWRNRSMEAERKREVLSAMRKGKLRVLCTGIKRQVSL